VTDPGASAGATAGPNLFVVGAAKCGTTSLWRHLGKHPEIFMSRVKEPQFFSADAGIGERVADPGEYAQLFAEGAEYAYRGEASTFYLLDPGCAERIRKACGPVRIVASLRDPVERAYSGYFTWVRLAGERRPFSQLVREELARGGTNLFSLPPPTVPRGFYAEQLERYLESFGDSVYVLFFDDLVADTRAAVGGLYEWLGVDPTPAETLDPAPVFPFQLPRTAAAELALRAPGVRKLGESIFRGPLRRPVQRLVFRREKPPLDPEIRRLLREVYAPHDERLRRLLGRPLPWDRRE
jgi:hypothetical protein